MAKTLIPAPAAVKGTRRALVPAAGVPVRGGLVVGATYLVVALVAAAVTFARADVTA